MTDQLHMIPVIGWYLFDRSLAAIIDNHGNRLSAWSASCSNGHDEGWQGFHPDRQMLELQIKVAAFKDLPGVITGTVDLGELPSPIAEYCDRAKQRAEQGR